MTIADVEQYLAEIRDTAAAGANDPENAHVLEDELRTMVLEAIAGGHTEDPQALCALALKSREIQFSRWYA